VVTWEWFAQMDAHQLSFVKSKICNTALGNELIKRVDELRDSINDRVGRFHAMGQPLKLYYTDQEG